MFFLWKVLFHTFSKIGCPDRTKVRKSTRKIVNFFPYWLLYIWLLNEVWVMNIWYFENSSIMHRSAAESLKDKHKSFYQNETRQKGMQITYANKTCSLCSRDFQNVKLRLDFVEIWSFYCHSDFTWNQILVNSNSPKMSFWQF